MYILEASGLVKTYGRKTALNDFSLSLKRGYIYGLLGPNGSGKTTALHIIAGIIEADSGSTEIVNTPLSDKKSRHHYGFAPDDLPLPGSMTGKEFLVFHDAMRRIDTKCKANLLIEALGLNDAVNQPIAQYSHGMKRKIQLVAALSHEPALLILDEPFRGLDPEAADILLDILKKLKASERTVLMATHDMLRAERDCDQVTILNDGAVIAEGPPHKLVQTCKGAQTLEDVFMIVTGRQAEKELRKESLKNLFN